MSRPELYCCALLCVLPLLVSSHADGGSAAALRRVLLVRDSARLAALEEAAGLSLDLPRQQADSPGEPAADQSQASTATSANSSSSSPGYRQESLASLTLGQQAAEPTPLAANQTRPFAWNETVQMARLKPSWLNVSERFKITGASIEELAFMMPAEFLLRQAFDSPILLKTRLGLLEGVRSIKFNKHLYTFLSVPYAQPPVGPLRFRAPRPVERWEGVLQATKWPPFCVQPSMTLASKSSPVHPLAQMMTEDCLYLNIWTPSLKVGPSSRRRPVMLWLHGGAFQYGGISVDENDASALALAGDLVVVTLNYRISAFGFLNANNKHQAPNNVGLLDQRLAMEWVQQNIKQFGGDPQQVTLFGESAGGHSVGLHLISPDSFKLFRRAIMQSGVPTSHLRSYDVNADNKGAASSESAGSLMMARRLKCLAPLSSAPPDEPEETTMGPDEREANSSEPLGAEPPLLSDQTLECMRAKSSLEILKALGAPGNAGFFPTGNDPQGFFPAGTIKESFDADDLKVGPQKDFLIGTNSDEGTFMLHYGMPGLFPARSPPQVDNVDMLKARLRDEIERLAREFSPAAAAASKLPEAGANATDALAEAQSASGSQTGSAQAHLYRPLLRMSSSVLEGFMPKSKLGQLAGANLTGQQMAEQRQSEFGKNIGSLITDIIFLCPARSLARTLSESGRNVYFYLYQHKSSLTHYHDWLGVTHHDEVEFVFGRPLRLADRYSGKDIEISQRLIKIWSHFAYTGQTPEQLGVKWPKYGSEDNSYMVLEADRASVGERYHDRVCNVYDNVISVHLQDAK